MGYKIGDILRYEFTIKDIIQSGGMGEVYIVSHKKSPLIFAAKTFKKEFFSKPELIDRFIHEANIWVGLSKHINIVQALNVFQIEGRPFIILEYAPYGSLEALIKNEKLSIDRALAIAIQICNGMAYVQETAGIVHCDLKPLNIMMGENYLVKVTDFGLAAVIKDWAEGKAERAAGLGTWQYMAPEQFIPEGSVWLSTDIYAMGIILFRLLTGHLPFKGSRWEDFKYQHTHVDPPKLRKINPDIYEELENIVLRCLKKKPTDRYQSFQELKENLERTYYLIKGRPFSLNDYLKQKEKYYVVIEKGRIITATNEIRQCSEVFNSAVTKYELGEYEKALELIDKALKIRPDFTDAWNTKGNVLMMLNKLKEAEECYKKSIQLDPNFPEAWVNLGVLYFKMEQYESSLGCVNKALEVSPDIPPFWAIRGAILLKLKCSSDALDSVNKALDLNPKCTEALWLKALILLQSGHIEQTITYLSRLLEVNPRDIRSLILKASILYQRKVYTEALQCLNILCKIKPENAECLELKGMCHGECGEYEEALKCFRKLTEVNPSNADGWYNTGLCLHMLGRIEEAKDFFLKTISIVPDHFKACNNLGAYYFIKKEYTEALEWYERALTIEPSNENIKERILFVKDKLNKNESYAVEKETVYRTMDNAYEQMERGNFREAYQMYLKLIKQGHEYTEILYNVGYCLWNLGEHEKSIIYCDKVLDRDPRHVHALNIKGNALDDLSEHKKAIECYKKAVEIDPNYYEAWNGFILQGYGRF